MFGKRLGTILELAPTGIFCFGTESKGRMFRGISGFCSILGSVDYTAVIFSARFSLLEKTAMHSTSNPADAFPLTLVQCACAKI